MKQVSDAQWRQALQLDGFVVRKSMMLRVPAQWVGVGAVVNLSGSKYRVERMIVSLVADDPDNIKMSNWAWSSKFASGFTEFNDALVESVRDALVTAPSDEEALELIANSHRPVPPMASTEGPGAPDAVALTNWVLGRRDYARQLMRSHIERLGSGRAQLHPVVAARELVRLEPFAEFLENADDATVEELMQRRRRYWLDALKFGDVA